MILTDTGTEAMYLLGLVGGFAYQRELWKRRDSAQLLIHNHSVREMERMEGLMEKYQDRPMDLADASLIALAEEQSFRQIFTVDDDFRFYRLADGSVLEVVP